MKTSAYPMSTWGILTTLVGLAAGRALVGNQENAAPAPAAHPRASPTYVGPSCSVTALPIVNPGFQTGSLSPWGVYNPNETEVLTNFSVVQEPVFETPPAWRLRVAQYEQESTYSQPRLQQADLPICPCWQYSVSFEYLVERGYPQSELTVGPTGNQELAAAQVQFDEPTMGWLQASALCNVTFVSSVNMDIGLSTNYQPPAGGTDGPIVLVDNVSMTPVQSLIAPGCPHEPAPLANANFASGALAPWVLNTTSGLAQAEVVATDPGEGQPYALRIGWNQTTVGPTILHPVKEVCMGYVYIYELAFNVVKPLVPASKYDQSAYYFLMDGCQGVGPKGGNIGQGYGNLPIEQPGPVSLKYLCRHTSNGAAQFKMYFALYYYESGLVDVVVDILSLSVRLATTDFDLGV